MSGTLQFPKRIMATAMRCLMAPEHEHVGNIAAALLAERKANEAERDRLREALKKLIEASDPFLKLCEADSRLHRAIANAVDAGALLEAGPVLHNDGWDQYRDEAGNPAFDGYDKEAGQ